MRTKLAAAIMIGCVVFLAAVLVGRQQEVLAQKEGQGAAAQETKAEKYGRGFQVLVEPGDEQKALNYYRDV